MTAPGTATVHLLTAVLLVCPYLCLSHTPAGASSTCGPRSVCCDCCSRSAPQQNQGDRDRPNQSDSRKGSGTCLCHGAVIDRHAEMPNPHQVVATYLQLDAAAPTDETSGRDDHLSTIGAACHFPAAESGRELRALIASFLL
jgi:hypothetical protein